MKTLLNSIVLVFVVLILAAGCGPKPQEQTSTTDNAAINPAQNASEEELVGELTIGIPCGVAMAYKDIRELFTKQYPGVQFKEHMKNIGPMTKEVRDGKTQLDVFLSLGEVEIKALMDAGLVKGKPVPFLRQAMQLCVQKGNPLGIKDLKDLAKPEVKTVVVCDEILTLGVAGQKALENVGIWEKLNTDGKIIRMGQPMQAKTMVIEKRADATFIYSACSNEKWIEDDPEHSIIGKADVVMTVPEEIHGGMHAVAAVMNTSQNPKLAQKFVDFLLTPEAQEAIAKWGYGKMNETESAPAN